MADSTITRDHCFACARAFKDGDAVYEDVNEGLIHAECCGLEREAYAGSDGEPLKPGEPIPAPLIYRIGPVMPPFGRFKLPPAMGEYRNFYRRQDGSVRMGPAWRDIETAQTMREAMTGETFITCRNMRFEDTSNFVAALAMGGARHG